MHLNSVLHRNYKVCIKITKGSKARNSHLAYWRGVIHGGIIRV